MATKSKNASRLKSVYAKYIAEIVQKEVKGQHIGLVSVNEVIVNDDNSLCKVYVTFLGSAHPHLAFEELKKSEGFVRSRLAKKVSVYKVPEIRFIYDESFDRADRIEAALRREEEDLQRIRPEEEDEDEFEEGEEE